MKLPFKKLSFTLSFAEKINVTVPPLFVLRSVIGSRLRGLCCVSGNTACGECMFSRSCAYGFAFESVVPKNNRVLKGRDRISQPVIMETEPFGGITGNSLVFSMIFLGAAIKYFPWFYQALRDSGKSGILKERILFTVREVRDANRSLLINEDTLDTGFEPEQWEYEPEPSVPGRKKDLMIRIASPLRFKADGRYTGRFSAGAFALCLHRRAQTLCSQYGSNDSAAGAEGNGSGEYRFSGGWDISESSLVWRDYTHYSARQKQPMRLGGLTGTMVLSGEFSPYEYALLRFAEIFHAGKNTNFGLGKIDLWERGRLAP
jgi:hypothetical protein